MKALDDLMTPPGVIIELNPSHYGNRVPITSRRGVMWHFDDSSSDKGAEQWFRDPAFKLSYNKAYTDAGRGIRLTPSIHHRAFHGGVGILEQGCTVSTFEYANGQVYRYGGLNTDYFGLAVTCGEHDQTTDEQFSAIVEDTAVIFKYCGWGTNQVPSRLVGHNEKAIFNPRDNPDTPKLWGKLGRKIDPVGNPDRPVLSLASGRAAVAALLDAPDHPLWQRFL